MGTVVGGVRYMFVYHSSPLRLLIEVIYEWDLWVPELWICLRCIVIKMFLWKLFMNFMYKKYLRFSLHSVCKRVWLPDRGISFLSSTIPPILLSRVLLFTLLNQRWAVWRNRTNSPRVFNQWFFRGICGKFRDRWLRNSKSSGNWWSRGSATSRSRKPVQCRDQWREWRLKNERF